jgi:hypothetical protein
MEVHTLEDIRRLQMVLKQRFDRLHQVMEGYNLTEAHMLAYRKEHGTVGDVRLVQDKELRLAADDFGAILAEIKSLLAGQPAVTAAMGLSPREGRRRGG